MEKILVIHNKYRLTGGEDIAVTNEVNVLKGDSKKARRVLGWKPKINFKQLVKEMVKNDLKNIF